MVWWTLSNQAIQKGAAASKIPYPIGHFEANNLGQVKSVTVSVGVASRDARERGVEREVCSLCLFT